MLLLALCIAVTVLLGAGFARHRSAGWFDTAVDERATAFVNRRPAWLGLLALADPVLVIAVCVAIAALCLAARRWRGAVLVMVSVPAATALTEYVLKPLVHRTLNGAVSFPSGHATGVFTVAAAITVLLAQPPRRRVPPLLRASVALGVWCLAGAVTVAIVGVHAHYATDTIGGAAVGTATVLLAALLLDRPPHLAAPR